MSETILERSYNYMNKLAESRGWVIDLTPNHLSGWAHASMLEICDSIKSSDSLATKDKALLKQLCDEIVPCSRVSVCQGFTHLEPDTDTYTEYRQVFNLLPSVQVAPYNSKYVPPSPSTLDEEFVLSSDDESVLKLKPNTQLRLFE